MLIGNIKNNNNNNNNNKTYNKLYIIPILKINYTIFKYIEYIIKLNYIQIFKNILKFIYYIHFFIIFLKIKKNS